MSRAHLRLGLLLTLAASACANTYRPFHHDLVEAEYVLPREDARSANLNIVALNDISVHSGECEFVHARARYDAYRGQASVDYALDESGFGKVDMTFRRNRGRPVIGSWNICVSKDLPVSLALVQSTGDADIDLSSVQIRGLSISSGTGDAEIDLGDAYLAEAEIQLSAGTGDVEFDAEQIEVVGASKLQVDAGTGDLDLFLPADVGLEIHVVKGTGDLSVFGLDRVGEPETEHSAHFANALRATAENTLTVEISAGHGDISVTAE